MSQFYNDSIFWIEVDKIKPNPFQPRRDFDLAALQSLADSIKQYGVLQALVVTRKEEQRPDGGISTFYELIAGERRLRASKLAGLLQVPVLIKTGEENDLMKLELAIIENIQREDLNPVDRARAFHRLANEFGFKHSDIGQKVGKSREYVTNTLRILTLPEHMLEALSRGKITEGHTRPLLMLIDRPQEQETLLKEILFKKLTVREAEMIARRIAQDRVRKKEYGFDPELVELEGKLQESLGTRVHIERRESGGQVMIDFFSNEDLKTIIELLNSNKQKGVGEMMERFIAQRQAVGQEQSAVVDEQSASVVADAVPDSEPLVDDLSSQAGNTIDDSEDDGIYSVRNFTV
jgi:ParB family transcriptional regulator, chromosome partitioning protein